MYAAAIVVASVHCGAASAQVQLERAGAVRNRWIVQLRAAAAPGEHGGILEGCCGGEGADCPRWRVVNRPGPFGWGREGAGRWPSDFALVELEGGEMGGVGFAAMLARCGVVRRVTAEGRLRRRAPLGVGGRRPLHGLPTAKGKAGIRVRCAGWGLWGGRRPRRRRRLLRGTGRRSCGPGT